MKQHALSRTVSCQKLLLAFLAAITLFVFTPQFVARSFAETTTLAWDSNVEDNLAGYKIYYSTDSADGPFNGTGLTQGASPIRVDLSALGTSATPSFQLSGLTAGESYYFAVSAYDDSGIESDYSNIVSYSAPLPVTYSLTASVSGQGTISPSGSMSILEGESKTFVITPDQNYYIADVRVDGASVGPVAAHIFNNVAASHFIEAVFAIDKFSITASTSGNGTIYPSGILSADFGTGKTVTIIPDTNYHVTDVLVDGASVGPVASYTFSDIHANHSIQASFAVDTFSVTATAGANGSISPAGLIKVSHGSAQSYSIIPDAGYRTIDVKVDNRPLGAVTDYIFSNIIGNHTIEASFDKIATDVHTPYGGERWAIPGTLEAENYDTDGPGVAYYDTSSKNLGEQYRTDQVDIWLSGSEGYYVGATNTGEWLEYSVDVEIDGQYSLDLRIATPNKGRLMHVEMDGINISGTINIPTTGSYSVWETVSTTVNLTEGEHLLRVVFDLGIVNLNWIDLYSIGFAHTAAAPAITPNGSTFNGSVEVSLSTVTPKATIYYTTNGDTPSTGSLRYTVPFTLTGNAMVKAYASADAYNDSEIATASFTAAKSAQQPYGGKPWMLPGAIEIENFDLGGNGIAYHDKTLSNMGGQYRTDGVDIWYASGAAVGYYVGATNSGEWLEYTVNIATAGQYTLDMQVATSLNGRMMHVELDGIDVTGIIAVPNTGAYSVWKSVRSKANLSAGRHVLRVVFDVGGLNCNRVLINTP